MVEAYNISPLAFSPSILKKTRSQTFLWFVSIVRERSTQARVCVKRYDNVYVIVILQRSKDAEENISIIAS